jgi:predicted membrane chloride channel (bestrophin family)
MWLRLNWQVLTEAVRLLHMPDFQRVTVDQQIMRYNENIAAVERLYSQPLPIAYLRHTSRCRRMRAHAYMTCMHDMHACMLPGPHA